MLQFNEFIDISDTLELYENFLDIIYELDNDVLYENSNNDIFNKNNELDSIFEQIEDGLGIEEAIDFCHYCILSEEMTHTTKEHLKRMKDRRAKFHKAHIKYAKDPKSWEDTPEANARADVQHKLIMKDLKRKTRMEGIEKFSKKGISIKSRQKRRRKQQIKRAAERRHTAQSDKGSNSNLKLKDKLNNRVGRNKSDDERRHRIQNLINIAKKRGDKERTSKLRRLLRSGK